MQLVAADILGPFPESDAGNMYILVAGDYFTRWMEVYPIPNQEAVTVARKLTDEFFFQFSPPEQLHTDHGRQFESKLVAEACKLLGIDKTRTTAYHPQSDGLVERFNRTLCLCSPPPQARTRSTGRNIYGPSAWHTTPACSRPQDLPRSA